MPLLDGDDWVDAPKKAAKANSPYGTALISRGADLEAYDLLPPGLRYALRECRNDFNASQALTLYVKYGERLTLQAIRKQDALLTQQVLRTAWPVGHPQAC